MTSEALTALMGPSVVVAAAGGVGYLLLLVAWACTPWWRH